MNAGIKPSTSALRARGGRRDRQGGIALFVVIVFAMLSMLLALWASRTAWFNEMVVGNDADYQRAFEAAQALIQDAELDIRGERADGLPCTPDGDSPGVCRTAGTEEIPLETQAVGKLLASLEVHPERCKDGLCAKRLGRQDFWNYVSTTPPTPTAAAYEIALDTLSTAGVGARYGQYTGATVSDNPILTSTGAWDEGGWYWTEVLKYDESSQFSPLIVEPAAGGRSDLLALNLMPSVVYRITAVAYGRKPGSTVVLQETYARTKRKD